MGSDGLMRVFWPLDLARSDAPGVLVGWRNSADDIFVVSLVSDIPGRRIAEELRAKTLFRKSQHNVQRIFDLCGHKELHVLGAVNAPLDEPARFDPDDICAFTRKNSRYPQIFCPPDCGMTLQVILFERPNPRQMEYLSLTPISLALEDNTAMADAGSRAGEEDMAEERREQERKARLVEKLRQHSVTRPMPTEKEQSLQTIIDQINFSHETMMLLQDNVALLKSRRLRRALSVSERVVESATSAWRSTLKMSVDVFNVLWPIVTTTFIGMMLFWRFVADCMLRMLEYRIKPEWAALKDISATAQQFDIRLQQFCYWPLQYVTLRTRKNDWDSVTTSHPDYIRFYNSLWLVANDIIIGIALGSYIIDNAASVSANIDYFLRAYTIEGMKGMISWLILARPGGVKLNEELGKFLGDLFLWVIEYWADSMTSVRPHLASMIYAIGVSSFAGASMPIALFSDALSILTLHIYAFYIASARIYNWQLTIIISLFHLFRGKKRNVLRNRIDSCDYDLDQLLIGTILFTLLIFLLPTVLVFYLTFASARMAIIVLKAALDVLLACLNHFPLFAIMLRLKDSKRLPGGVWFELKHSAEIVRGWGGGEGEGDASTVAGAYIRLHSTPLPLGAMFHQYAQLGQRIRKHYVSPHVILCLMTGRFVPPIHRRNLYSMQYSMLPTRRAGMVEVWQRLMENPRARKGAAAGDGRGGVYGRRK